jgi:hypothetical protein
VNCLLLPQLLRAFSLISASTRRAIFYDVCVVPREHFKLVVDLLVVLHQEEVEEEEDIKRKRRHSGSTVISSFSISIITHHQ